MFIILFSPLQPLQLLQIEKAAKSFVFGNHVTNERKKERERETECERESVKGPLLVPSQVEEVEEGIEEVQVTRDT